MKQPDDIQHSFARGVGARIVLAASLLVSSVLAAGCSSSEDQPETRQTGTAREVGRVPQGAPSSAGVSVLSSSGFKPGELIVKYRSDGNHALVECAERWMAERRSFASATADHSASLDELHKSLGISAARALMPGRRGLTTKDAKQRLSLKTIPAAMRAVRPLGAKARSVGDLVNLYVLELPPQADVVLAARKLAADPHVEYAQPNYLVKASLVPNDPFFATSGSWGQIEDDLWGIKKIAAPTAWDTTQGDAVIVAVVDTGLDLTHPDIAANVWQNSDEIPGNGVDDDQNGFVDDVNGWNFDAGNADPSDDFGHGTHVSGTIAAVGNNAIGVIGVAPRAKIQALKGLNENGGGTTDHLALGIVYAAQNGARVVNNSWGCAFPCPENPVVEDVVDLAHDSGVTVVFSAGNTAADVSQFSPQNRPNVIVVAASDQADQRVGFSNHGFVDVAAPGGGFFTPPPDSAPFRNILSLKSSVCNPLLCPPELVVGDLYLRQAGTSMAAPHVAGAAALVLAAHPSYSPEQVRQALRRGSADTGAPGVDTDSGYGRLDAAAAVSQPTPLEALITGPLTTFDALAGSSVPITGTAAGPGFANYFLDIGFGETPTSFTTFAASTTPVVQGTLGTLNLANVPDGINTLRVRATTTNGRIYEDRQRAVVDHVVITEPPYHPPHTATVRIYGSDPVSIRGTAAPAGFVRYDLAVLTSDGTPVPGANITESNGGTLPVTDGLLGVWNTTGIATGGYQIALTVQVTTGAPITRITRLGVDRTLHPGWPVDFAPAPFFIMQAGNTDHLTAADVNGDGRAELLVAFSSEVMVFGHTGAALPGWPQTVAQGSITARSPVVANVTGSAAVEVIGADGAGSIYVWSANGTLLFQAEGGSAPCEEPSGCTPTLAVADVNRDGINDIITSDSSGTLTVFRVAQSGLVPLFRQTFPKPVLSAPAIGDMAGDGQLEIAVTATDSILTPGRATDLYVVGRNGVLAGWPRRVSEGFGFVDTNQYPVIGDIDRNGRLDVVMSSTTGVLTAFAANGTILPGWPRSTTPALAANLPTLGDLNGDGRLDTLLGSFSASGTLASNLFALSNDGTVLPGWPVTVGSPNIAHFGFGAAALADIDGDGGVEAIASSDSIGQDPANSLRAYHADGSIVAGFPKPTVYIGTTGTGTAAVADMDGDGLLELAWLDAAGKAYLWDLTARASAKRPWPMFQHDAQHTGQADPLLRATFESRDGDPRNNLIQPKLRVVNGGGSPVPLGEITMRYWYTNETAPSTQVFQFYFAQNETNWASIPANQITSRFVSVSRPLADTYLEIGFTSSAGTLSPAGAVGLEFNVHAQNWHVYDERNDYSYSPSTARIDWDRVTIYRGGALVWGKEP